MATIEESYLIAICFIGIGLLIVISISVLAVIKLCILDSSSWINKTYRNLTVIAIFSSTLCSTGDFIHILIRFLNFPNRPYGDIYESVMVIIVMAIYYFGCVTFYLLLLQRIKAIFGLNTCVTHILSALICIYIITATISCIIVYLVHNNPENWPFLGFAQIILSVDDFILNLALFITFFRKLRNIVGKVDAKIITSNYGNQMNILLINAMTKHCVLFGIALIVNQLYFLYDIYDLIFNVHRTIQSMFINTYIIRCVENAINVLILWLVLKINYNQYICICKYCHLCIGKCCIKQEPIVKENSYQELHSF